MTSDRETIETELQRIDSILSNGWIETKPKRLAELQEQKEDLLDALNALYSDEALVRCADYDPNTTTAPVAPSEDWRKDYRPVPEGALLHPDDVVGRGNKKPFLAFTWGMVATSNYWVRPVTRDIDIDYLLKKAKKLAASITDPIRRERLLYEIAKEKQYFSSVLADILKAAEREQDGQ